MPDIRDIILAPDPILKKVARAVDGVDDDLRRLIDDMYATMYDAKGIGLAAPQIAISKRVLVLDVDQDEQGKGGNPMVFINPEITWESDVMNTYMEGCLSLPSHYAEVERPETVRVKYLDYDGKLQEQEVDGLLATCLQHEIDHLDGLVFVDHISNLRRNMIIKKMKKMKKTIEKNVL